MASLIKKCWLLCVYSPSELQTIVGERGMANHQRCLLCHWNSLVELTIFAHKKNIFIGQYRCYHCRESEW